MCLLVAAWDLHPRYRLVLVGNRDEFHARPSAPLGWWHDRPHVLAGRDLAAGGTWLGIDRRGRLGVVTNFRDLEPARPGAPSRGALITEFLTGDAPAAAYGTAVATRAADYSGFSLLTLDDTGLCYTTNRPQAGVRRLGPGLYGLSNECLDTPWPKLERARAAVGRALEARAPEPEALFAGLLDRTPAPDEQLPDTGLGLERERLLSAPFIVDAVYGTRCTTLVLLDRDGGARVEERRFGPDGKRRGETMISFDVRRGPPPAQASGAHIP